LNSLEHIAISAAAGSGKTYQLTNRFIYLLHLSEKPERIIALTFTRVAAGEFFHNIIEKLCTAASSSEKAQALSKELDIEAGSERYHHLLRILISSMHRLNLQTLDSFFFRVVSAFSLELGLSGSLKLLDQSSEPRIRKAVRDQIVHDPSELSGELQEFWYAFKQATYGKEERSIDRIVSDFIKNQYALYLASRDQALWGQVDRIWPTGCPWKPAHDTDWDQLGSDLLSLLPKNLSSSQRKDFETLALKLQLYPAEEKTNALLARALAQAEEIFGGQTVIQCGRGKNNQASLDGPACAALADCLRAIVWHHLKRALENTQGVYRILQAYDQSYQRLVRRPGKLAFADLTNLLSPAQAGTVAPMMRELMDFRLDGQFDHWLFDEFQDTSRPQWSVVANLIDEIVQDPSGERSFFYVGDTKQCLYLWRNSDDRLFHDIQVQYENIQSYPLSVSWRSAPAILEAVNTVFEDHTAIIEHFSEDAAARWARAWQPHAASSKTKNDSGFACWLNVVTDDGLSLYELILQVLEELKPLERGMTVGVLARNNKNVNAIADFLRENTTDVAIHTGSAVMPASDNPAGVALLSMLRLAAHPGEDSARGFLNLIDRSTKGRSLLEAVGSLRHLLLTESYENAVRFAAEAITEHLEVDDLRHRERLGQLIQKARAFDSEDSRDIDGLHDYLRDSSSGGQSATDTIIVETVHKSKGLEYDVVIYANEDNTNRSSREISPLYDAHGNAEWLIEPIKKDLMEADPQLSAHLAQSTSESGFGNLCNLYVAMTRAKRALYMISKPKSAHSGTTVKYLSDILGNEVTDTALFSERDYPVAWSHGDPDWYERFKFSPKSTSEAPRETEAATYAPAHPRLQLARPSSGKPYEAAPAQAFNTNKAALDFGSQVHDAFEHIEWFEAGSLDSITTTSDETIGCLKSCFSKQDIKALFTKPDTPCTVWRERAFSFVEGDQFYNGIFDRVVLHHNANGQTISAEIIDFKTDRIHKNTTVKEVAERHRPQLEAYRKALSKIIGLDEQQIQLKLLFTDLPTVLKV